MTEENAIKIEWDRKDLGCRTIDPTDGFDIEKDFVTFYNFNAYKSNSHDTRAKTTIIENQGDKVLIRVESIDWHKGSQYPYTTQGCFLFQQTIEKYNRLHISVDRVPCSKSSIDEAVDFLTPAEVKKAKESGRKVKRQGDFFFVEMKTKSNYAALNGSRHEAVKTKKGISIQHPEHAAVNLGSGKWKAIQRKTMNHMKAD